MRFSDSSELNLNYGKDEFDSEVLSLAKDEARTV